MAILFKDQPKGMDLKNLGKGRIRKDLRGVPVQLLPGSFLQGVRDVDKLKEGFWLFCGNCCLGSPPKKPWVSPAVGFATKILIGVDLKEVG